jgi:hypothetical protein
VYIAFFIGSNIHKKEYNVVVFQDHVDHAAKTNQFLKFFISFNNHTFLSLNPNVDTSNLDLSAGKSLITRLSQYIDKRDDILKFTANSLSHRRTRIFNFPSCGVASFCLSIQEFV